MSPITKEFTKEQLQQIIETDHVQCGEASSLARIALASLEAVPVGTFKKGPCGYHPSFHEDAVPLYTAPPSPVSVPAAMEMDDDFDSSFEHGKAVGWNACRAAMLQGANGNSPVIPDGYTKAAGTGIPIESDGWQLVPVEPTEEMIAAAMCSNDVLFDKEDDTLFRVQHSEIWRTMLAAAPQQEVK
ncbi:hypothetical protein [Enterobacter kobei]|uniref:hypothetical protein n=1 Tax=Enterobacter kobei TaxID=208224 RepID=UPI00403FA788